MHENILIEKSKIREKDGVIAKLENDAHKMKFDNRQLTQKYEKRNAQLEKTEKQCISHQNTIDKISKDFTNLKKKANELLNNKDSTIKQLNEKNRQLITHEKELHNKIDKLTNDLSEIQTKLIEIQLKESKNIKQNVVIQKTQLQATKIVTNKIENNELERLSHQYNILQGKIKENESKLSFDILVSIKQLEKRIKIEQEQAMVCRNFVVVAVVGGCYVL